MSVMLKIQGKLKNSRELSVDLLVIDKMDNIVFSRAAIDNKIINRGIITRSDIEKITSKRNVHDVNQVLKDRDKDYNVTKRVKDDNLNELREILAGYIEYNNKIEEVSEKYMSIMKNFPDALSGEFYLDASGCNYNELLDLWPSPVTFVNIEALEKMKDILDKSIAVHNVYTDLLKGFDK